MRFLPLLALLLPDLNCAASLAPLGPPVAVTPVAVLRAEPDSGKVERFTIYPGGD